MDKVHEWPARRQDGASPPAPPRRRLLAAGVIRGRRDTRPTLRLIAAVDTAVVKITHFPAEPKGAA